MTVHFIGAGPGDPELITVRGLRLIESCPVCLYAGSLVPETVVAAAPADARVIDTASLTLDDIIDEIVAAHDKGQDVARVHSGDPSLYGAIAEQIRRLKALGIDYRIVPGVPAYAAAAAGLGIELTVPEVAQSLILTRTAMKSSAMPPGEELTDLVPFYGEDCPVIVAYRVGWPDEDYIHGTLSDIRAKVQEAKITRTALIFVGPALAQTTDFRDSALYDAAHAHILRPKRGRAADADG